MASTFAGFQLFNSGPHRFIIGRVGRLIRGPFESPFDLPYTTNEGVRELTIQQLGRLVAASNTELWSLIDAIQAQCELPRTGTLTDHWNRQWTGMTLTTFEPAQRIDRGRVFSVGYRVVYLRFGG